LDRHRTAFSFGLTTVVGVSITLLAVFGCDWIFKLLWQQQMPQEAAALPYLLTVANGLLVGFVLGRMVPYFPSWEGCLSSLAVVSHLLVRDQYQVGLDNIVEWLLKFECHFAALSLSAFLLFVVRGGGLYYPMFVGLRYLRFKMITAISMAGGALGVAAMIVVLSVMSGFENDLKDKILGTNAHAIVQKRGTDFIEYPNAIEKIRRVGGVVAVSPFVYNEAMVSSEYNISGVFIKGIDPKTAAGVTNLDRGIQEGSLDLLEHPEKIDGYVEERNRKGLPKIDDEEAPKDEAGGKDGLPSGTKGKETPALPSAAKEESPEPFLPAVPVPDPLRVEKHGITQGIFIGKELMKILKVSVGDRINVVSPLSEELGPSGPMPKARAFRVAGVFYTGMYEYDAKSIYITLDAAQQFFGMGDAITGIALKFTDIDKADAICGEILSALDGYPYFTRTWYQMNKNLFSALKMEKIAMFILVVIVTLVSAFGIISTLIMLVWEKVKEIAILKSMGATGDGVMKIFMVEGIVIGLMGTLLGLLLGWVTCVLLKNYGLQLNPEVYYIEKLPVNMDALEFILIAGIAVHISFIATLYPSGRASRLHPVEGLRYE
jgi:lipoprotein-releasing system permease protein